MPLPDFRINPYIQAPAPSLSKEFGEGVAQRLGQYETSIEANDLLADANEKLLQNILPFKGDQLIGKDVMDKTRNQIDEMAAAGDYENMGRRIKKTAMGFDKDVQPLFENQARYQGYMAEIKKLQDAKEIGADTANRAKQFSTEKYEGLDPKNIQGSMFNGFMPSPDVNMTEEINEFLTGWKSDAGGGADVIQPDGSYRKIAWERATENDINIAIDNFLKSNPKVKDYQNTQYTIGNMDRFNSELNSAWIANLDKHAFNHYTNDVGFAPKYYVDAKNAEKLSAAISLARSPSYNRPAGVKGWADSYDPDTGKSAIRPSLWEDTKNVVKAIPDTPTLDANVYGKAVSALASIFAGHNRDPEEVKKAQYDIDKQVDILTQDTYINEQRNTGKLSDEIYNSAPALEKYMNDHAKEWNNIDYRNKSVAQYKAALPNTQVVQSGMTYDLRTGPGGVPMPLFQSVKDDDILRNMQGKDVGVLGTDEAITDIKENHISDINTLLETVENWGGKNNYQVMGIQRAGFVDHNPFNKPGHNEPGMRYDIILKSKGDSESAKSTRVVSFVANTPDKNMQPVQDVYDHAYNFLGGFIPFQSDANGWNGEPIWGSFRVRAAGSDPNITGRGRLEGVVEVWNREGTVKLKDIKYDKKNGVPQNIPFSQFQEVYFRAYNPRMFDVYKTTNYTEED